MIYFACDLGILATSLIENKWKVVAPFIHIFVMGRRQDKLLACSWLFHLGAGCMETKNKNVTGLGAFSIRITSDMFNLRKNEIDRGQA